MTPRLKTAYDKEIISQLMTKLNLKNKHEVPKIEKIILNRDLRKEMQLNAQGIARSLPSWGKCAEFVIKVLKEVSGR